MKPVNHVRSTFIFKRYLFVDRAITDVALVIFVIELLYQNVILSTFFCFKSNVDY